MKNDILLYLTLQNKPITISDLVKDHPEWKGNCNIMIDVANIMVLFGLNELTIKAIHELWKDHKVALLDLGPQGGIAYDIGKLIPSNVQMADKWDVYPETHWFPTMLCTVEVMRSMAHQHLIKQSNMININYIESRLLRKH